MPEEQPPNQQNGPRKPGETGGSFNWRVLILFSVALGLLTLAFVVSGDGKGKAINFKEFRDLMQERKVLNDPETLRDYPLEIVTNESSINAQITGWYAEEPIYVPDGKPTHFRVRVNLALRGPDLQQLLGAHAVDTDPDDLPIVENEKSINFEQFETWMLKNEVLLAGDKLRIATLKDSGEAVLVGVHQPYKMLPAEQIRNMKPKPQKFRVSVDRWSNKEALAMLTEKLGVPNKPSSNYMRTILLSFLPILILIILLFLLFRHQMKAAGRGAMSFGKSKARMLSLDRNKVTFKDVAGIQEAKEELWEIVDFLKDPASSRNWREYSQGRSHGGTSRDRQDPPGSCHRGGGERSLFLDQRLRFRGDVRGSRCQPRARHVRTGQAPCSMPHLHR